MGCHVNWCFADDLGVVSDTEEEMQIEEMAWLADWDGENGIKSQHWGSGCDDQ